METTLNRNSLKETLKDILPPDRLRYLEDISNEELDILTMMLQEYTEKGDSTLYKSIKAIQWRWEPTDPETFLTDDYFMGNMGRALYDVHKEHFINIYSRKDIVEVIMSGAIGIGKDYLSVIMGAYEYHILACLKNPQEYLGLAPNTPVVGAILNVRADKSTEYFDNLRSAIDQIPFFKDHYQRNPRKNSVLEFPNRVIFKDAGSTELSAIGSNVYLSLINEMNFMRRVKNSKKGTPDSAEYNQALVIYQNLQRRLKSRFLLGGIALGKIILISSRRYPNDFLEEHLHKAEKDPNTYIIDHALWDVLSEEKIGKKWFFVELGDLTRKARIIPLLEEEEYKTRFSEESRLQLTRSQQTVITVPEAFRKDFEDNIDDALKDIGGRAILTLTPYISNREKIAKALNVVFHKEKDEQERLSVEAATLRTPVNKLITNLYDDFEIDFTKFNAKFKFAPRYLHLDLALNRTSGADMAGVVCSCFAGWKELRKEDKLSGKIIVEKVPKIWTDFAINITASPYLGEIDFEAIRMKIIYTMAANGIKFNWLTCDGFQCLRKNTKIPLLNGVTKEIKDIIPGDYVYSLDENHNIVAGKILFSGTTRKKTLWRLTLDNGEILEGSDDHPIMLRNGEFVPLRSLQEGQSLMPLYRFNYPSDAYEHVYNPGDGKQYRTHLLVLRTNDARIVHKIRKRIKLAGFKNWKDFQATPTNHKVFKVECLNIEEDVWDITVENYHNFATSSGIFVHNSIEMLQILTKKGFKAEQVSVDRDDAPYSVLKQAIYTDRLDAPYSEKLNKELAELERNQSNGKIDHGLQGSKDLSDGLAANVFKITEDYGTSVTESAGSSLITAEEDEITVGRSIQDKLMNKGFVSGNIIVSGETSAQDTFERSVFCG